MSFDKSFANNERLVFYPKFFRRFFCFLPMASMLIGIGFLAEFMMVRGGDYYGSAKRGSGYAIAAAFALWAIYITICLMNERLTIDQTAVCIEPINGEFYSLAKPPERYEWKKNALIKQTSRFFRNYDFLHSRRRTLWHDLIQELAALEEIAVAHHRACACTRGAV